MSDPNVPPPTSPDWSGRTWLVCVALALACVVVPLAVGALVRSL